MSPAGKPTQFCLYLTYEELKQGCGTSGRGVPPSLYLTYEELKPVPDHEHVLSAVVYILPMRN